MPIEIKVPFLRSSSLLGDAVASVTQAVGIKPCGGCNKRKDILNSKVRLIPYRLPLPEGHILKQQGQITNESQALLTRCGNFWYTMEFSGGVISKEKPFSSEDVAKADFAARMRGE